MAMARSNSTIPIQAGASGFIELSGLSGPVASPGGSKKFQKQALALVRGSEIYETLNSVRVPKEFAPKPDLSTEKGSCSCWIRLRLDR